MPIIDFKEIPEAHIATGKQDSFEMFSRDFLEGLGYRIISNPDRGADGGKDIVVEEKRVGVGGENTVRWLVSCKHKAHSGSAVKPTDDPNIRDRVEANQCDGFIGFYSTLPSSGLANNILGLNKKIETQIFDKEKIEGHLLRTPRGVDLAKRYFPLSIKKWDVNASTARIKAFPKWFQALDHAINDLHSRYIAFPSLNDFIENKIPINRELVDCIQSRVSKRQGPSLVTGKWGSGKTVFALSLGCVLQHDYSMSIYYLDLTDHIGRDYRNIISEVLSKALIKFSDSTSFFIIDNAHVNPMATYRIAQWAFVEKANVMFLSRPVSIDMTDEKQYYPKLFGIPFDLELGSEKYIEEETEETGTIPDENSNFILRSNPEAIRWMVKKRLNEINSDYDISDCDLDSLRMSFGNNLKLIALIVTSFNPSSGEKIGTNLVPIYETLTSRFKAIKFPEVYLIAALNYFDCPADINAIFPSQERLNDFFNDFFPENALSQAVFLKRGRLVFGINPAEARLLCESGIYYKERNFRDKNGQLPCSFYALLQLLIVRYAANQPANPYLLLRSLRWAAFEASEFDGSFQEEEVRGVLESVMCCKEFLDFLRQVILPNRLTMLGLANIARLFFYLKLPHQYYSQILDPDIVKDGIIRLRQHLQERLPQATFWFTWREFTAWRHLKNIDIDLASFFLKQFEYSIILNYGAAALPRVSNLLLMAGRTEWLKKLVIDDLEKLFGDQNSFLTAFNKLNVTKLTFFIRHAGLFGDQAIDLIKSYISPENMANVVTRLQYVHISLFQVIARNFGSDYFNKFLSNIDDDYIYSIVYGGNISTINFHVSDKFFSRFLKHDLINKIESSSCKEIQLFLRNICYYGFQNRHRASVSKCVEHLAVKNCITEKIKHCNSANDIAHLIRHISIIAPDCACWCIESLYDIDMIELMSKSRLSDISWLLLNIWVAGDYYPSKLISEKVFSDIINTKLSRSTTNDLICIGGVLDILQYNLHVPIIVSELSEKTAIYLNRAYLLDNYDVVNNIRKQNKALMLSLSICGVKYFLNSVEPLIMSEAFDSEFASKFIMESISDIEINTRSAFSVALGKLPATSQRKVDLFQRALIAIEEAQRIDRR